MQALARRLACPPERAWPDLPVPVALVITDLDVGGAERSLVALALGLDRRRWKPSVICLGSEGRLVEPLRTAGIETRCLNVDRRRPISAVLRLAAALRAKSPALVQSFLFHANIAARLAAPLAGVPWVIGGLRVAEREKAWHLRLDRLTCRLAAGSVCVSAGVERYSRVVGRLPAERLIIVPNGIDAAPYDLVQPISRDAIGVPSDAFLALYVGRLDPQKGVGVLLEAAEIVVGSQPAWHLAVAGDGPERDRLQQLAATRAALSGHVHWLGQRSDIPGLMKTSDVIVLPSLWEGMPNVVLEAMGASRAVIATAVEGSEDLVIPGQTGWLVPPANAEALSVALRAASIDLSQTRHLGQMARKRVEQVFSLARTIAAYERLWTRTLGYPDEAPDPNTQSPA